MSTQNYEPVAPTTPTPPPAAPLPPQPAPLPPATVAQHRSPGVAVVLSFLPGLGHLYLGLYQRGIAFFLAFATSIWLAGHNDLGILIPFVWFFALIDAYRQAQAINCCSEPLAPAVTPTTRRSNLGFGIFLTVLGVLLLYNQFYPLDLTFLVDWRPMILVMAGVYLLAKHVVELRRQKAAERPPETY